jgi:integrase
MSVRKIADGWIADVTVDGVRRTRKAKTKAEALAKQKELLEQIATRSNTNRSSGTGITLKEARALSLRIRWKGLAWERTAGIYSQHAVEFFGPTTQLDSIKAPDVERWRQYLLEGGNSPATVNHKVSCLKGMINDALLHGYIGQKQDLPQQLKIANTKDRIITKEELATFCRIFQEWGETEMADVLVLMTLTCTRWGEIERLRGEDVDLERGLITFWKTKNGSPRTIALGPKARSIIEPHVPPVPRQRVFGLKYDRARELFDRAKAYMGLSDDRKLTMHCARHTGATRMAQAGVPLQQIQAYGGWKTLAAVQRYMHLQTHHLTACTAAIEA